MFPHASHMTPRQHTESQEDPGSEPLSRDRSSPSPGAASSGQKCWPPPRQRTRRSAPAHHLLQVESSSSFLRPAQNLCIQPRRSQSGRRAALVSFMSHAVEHFCTSCSLLSQHVSIQKMWVVHIFYLFFHFRIADQSHTTGILGSLISISNPHTKYKCRP